MLPVLFTFNNTSITSMTVFLYLAFFITLFVIWRITKYYEMDPEKVLDIFLLTSLSSLIGARLYFVIFRLNIFDDLLKIVNIFKYPGYSFWGGFIVGLLTFWYLCKSLKVNFWKAADFAVVGLLIGLSVASFGCLLGGCQYGQLNSSFLAVEQVGLIGKRFPIQFIEGSMFFLGFIYLSRLVYRYYPEGSIAAKGLIILGLIKLLLEPFRGEVQLLPNLQYPLGTIFSLGIILLGVYAFYRARKKTLFDDIKYIYKLIISGRRRSLLISNISKSWYNFKVNFKFRISRLRKDIYKVLHVRSNPREFEQS
jgi:phosphatidylglycerol---prolipoprotein diacylglyceryl transferase